MHEKHEKQRNQTKTHNHKYDHRGGNSNNNHNHNHNHGQTPKHPPKQHYFPDLRKKKEPFRRQHENKNHNKTTNGTAGSGGYLRNFLAVS